AGFADWNASLIGAVRAKDYDDAAAHALVIARRWPDQLPLVDAWRLLRIVEKTQGNSQYDLLAALYAAHWDPDDEISWTWLDFVRLLVERGEPARAAEVAESVQNPYAVIAIRVDRRFDPAVQQNAFDLAAVKRSWTETAAARSQRRPRSLARVCDLVKALALAGRSEEALRISADALATARSGRMRAYDDAEEEIPWLMNARADVLASLRRMDEAVAELSVASQIREEGRDNLSPKINLADLANHLRRPEDAWNQLRLVKESDASESGLVVLSSQRFIAAFLMKDSTTAERALAYVASHEADAPLTAAYTLAAAGHLDEA